MPFSTQWQDLKDLLRPAGRILRADIALAPDGRSKGWGTAVFATPQEAQNAIDTFDGWEVDGRIIKVRWDKYQGSTSSASQPSPQLAPATAGLSSPQMMHAQLSPAQTPRPNEYVAMPTNQGQPSWQPQYLTNLRPMPSAPPPPTMQTSTSGMPMTAPQPQFAQYAMQPQYPTAVPTGQTPPAPTGTYAVYNTPGGWYPNYAASPMPPLQPMPPQVRLPLSSDPFLQPQLGQQQPTQGQRNDSSSNSRNVYGM